MSGQLGISPTKMEAFVEWGWLEAAAVALISAVAGAIGFLAKRLFTRARVRESTDLYLNIANLMGRLQELGLSMEDVRDMEGLLRSKVRQADSATRPEEPEKFRETQADMNHRAVAMLELADANISAAIAELRPMLSEEEKDAFTDAQHLWVAFRDKAAEFEALQFEGGSMQPLVRDSEKAALAEARLKQIKATVEARRKAVY